MTATACSTDSMSLTFNSYQLAAYIDLHLENHSFANMPKRGITGIQRLTKPKTDPRVHKAERPSDIKCGLSFLLWGTHIL